LGSTPKTRLPTNVGSSKTVTTRESKRMPKRLSWYQDCAVQDDEVWFLNEYEDTQIRVVKIKMARGYTRYGVVSLHEIDTNGSRTVSMNYINPRLRGWVQGPDVEGVCYQSGYYFCTLATARRHARKIVRGF
jgi:hypothetical protein